MLLVFAAESLSQAIQDAVKFQTYSGAETLCETEMAYLDNYAITLQNNLQHKAYVIVYGGRSDTAPHELRQRRARIRRYLVENRGIESGRIQVVSGGFREHVAVELWLVKEGSKLPEAKPSVRRQEVRLKKTGWQFNCSSFY